MGMMFTAFEPKVTFRYLFKINDIPAYMCKASGMPNLENGEISIDYNNVNFKVKGRSTWGDINVTLYDPVEDSGARYVHDWINAHHNSTSGVDGFAFAEYKRPITIEALDPSGAPAEAWALSGAYIGTSNWGEMDWSTEESKQIELTIKYDFAVLVL